MIRWIREAAGTRFSQLELNLNLMAVSGKLPRYQAMRPGTSADDVAQSDAAVPLLKGTTEHICNQLLDRRARFGIGCFMVGEKLVDALAPIVSRLAGS